MRRGHVGAGERTGQRESDLGGGRKSGERVAERTGSQDSDLGGGREGTLVERGLRMEETSARRRRGGGGLDFGGRETSFGLSISVRLDVFDGWWPGDNVSAVFRPASQVVSKSVVRFTPHTQLRRQ